MASNSGKDANGTQAHIIHRESSGKKLIEQIHVRLFCIAAFFFLSFFCISYRLVEVMLFRHTDEPAKNVNVAAVSAEDKDFEDSTAALQFLRGDIVDRNGLVLATTLATESLFANPSELVNPAVTAQRIVKVFPDLDKKDLEKKLSRDSTFVWIKRNLTPKEQHLANDLGIPGLYFQSEQKRVYPYGNLLSHVVGFVGLDQRGLAGVERYFDEPLRDTKKNKDPLKLSIDLRVQNIVHEELKKGMDSFNAIGATGIVMDVHSGEILAMANLPDFDPHHPGNGSDPSLFNRASLGVYEMGSTFKTFTIAAALDYKLANLNDSFDATHPIQYSHFTISDAHPMNRWLTVPEIYTYSSNVGTVRMVMDLGAERQQKFLRKLGLMDPMHIELPETTSPHYPSDWQPLSMMTISYGHGMSVTPLHLVRAIAAVVGDGYLKNLTLLKDGNAGEHKWQQVISENTSHQMRRLMRMVVEYGTGKKADVPGYRVGGKTGTAEKAVAGGYSHNAKLALFVSAFPVDNPDYVVLVMVDEPKGNKSTAGFATGGWISAPIVGNIISRMATMYGIRPMYDIPEDEANQYWVNNANQKFLHAVSY